MSTTASSPTGSTNLLKFSHPPYADIIIRSSDSHDFQVQKLYVVDSSPVLGEQIMAATCRGVGSEATSEASCEATSVSGETKDTVLPVIQVAEDHAIISSLLTFVFPVPPILPPTVEQIFELLSVAEKYGMTTALIRIRQCASSRDPSFICPENALHAYCLALNYGLLKETLEAAEVTLKSPMTIQDLEDKLDTIHSVTLYKLWKYRQRVLGNLDVILIQEFCDSEVYRVLSTLLATAEALPLHKGLNLPGADVVLRSSDLVSFHVHKSILAMSSPFFTDLFSLPQPPDGEVIEGLPVVQVSEDAELLYSLFTVLYPIPSAMPESYEKTLALLASSQKYNMTTVLSNVRSEIGRQLPTTKASFRAYAIAYSKQLIPEIETTAR
ncbi:hypothetical protein EDB85DRAFT_2128052, partial [Lactarius pseudohatsudake]